MDEQKELIEHLLEQVKQNNEALAIARRDIGELQERVAQLEAMTKILRRPVIIGGGGIQ